MNPSSAVPVLAGVLMFSFLSAQQVDRQAPPAPKLVFDEAADAQALVAAAVRRAAKDNRRVLVVWGKDDDDASRELEALWKGALRRLLQYEFELVPVHPSHKGLAAKLGVDLEQEGIPLLSVIDAAGQPIAQQTAAGLRTDAAIDAKAVSGFLTTWQAKPQDASALLDAALAEARKSDRRVLVHLGAPW